MAIHPSAIVDPSASIAASAVIGPFCVINAGVEVGEGTHMMANVYVDGRTKIGAHNIFFPFSSVGVAPQDLKYRGEASETIIGDRNRIREFVTIHRGTEGGGMVTRIGNDNLLMAYTHIAHDVHVADYIVLSHGTTVGGHVAIHEWAVVGAHTGIHQFCRIGRHSMIGGYSVITQDVLPYATTSSPRESKVFGANRTGLERRGFSNESIEALQNSLRILTRAGLNTSQAIEKIQSEVPATREVVELLEFIASCERGFIK